ncbi:E3 ubiquitin-protein ligase TRIM71-like [Dendronephthya gigantea]|uniref:E3 ubiquitin-protein ligase TRIM71-like n=1 Tax=Dendronephthya gigantea TaxID=151771 RepID=UPI00106A5679|nr:E3 ubiquitin-protein ligase TRIM71-like [Dendronephthya gigantea]
MSNVVYNPKVPGEHEISVTVRGEHLPDSPTCVNVKKGHVDYNEKVTRCLTFAHRGKAPGCLVQPRDVAVRNNGDILVADTLNHRVQIFNSKGKFVACFGGGKGRGLGQLSFPSGIAISPHCHVIVSDHGNHRVQIFSSNGVFLRSFGGHGDTKGLMDHPTGIAVDEEGHIVVVDQYNHRVQMFDQNGVFIRQFGCYGNKDGQLDRPMYVAITPDGDIVVTDSGNHRVQVFDVDGRHRETFGQRGTKDGEFYNPTGITIDASGYVVVSDQTAGIQIFKPDLEFAMKLVPRSVDKLESPMGLDYTPEGQIVAVDKGRSNVKIFYPEKLK